MSSVIGDGDCRRQYMLFGGLPIQDLMADFVIVRTGMNQLVFSSLLLWLGGKLAGNWIQHIADKVTYDTWSDERM